jgi:hypothetical protein
VTNPPAATTDPDGLRTYEYPPTGELLPSYSAIKDGTFNKPWIKKWYGNTATAWCVDNIGLLARTKRLQGRTAAIDLGKDRAEQERNLKADVGTYIHDVKEALILWAASPGRTGADVTIPALPEHLEGALYKVGPDEFEPAEYIAEYMVDGFLNWVSAFNPRFLAAEMTVYNQPVGYAGTLDDIIALDGYAISIGTGLHGEDELIPRPGNVLRICGDTKTGKEPEGTWKEQLAAYRRATECRLPLGDIIPMPETDAGAVLHLRPEHPDGFLFYLVSAGNDEEAWTLFQERVQVFRKQYAVRGKPGTSVRALRPDGTMPPKRLCDLSAEGYSYTLGPLRKALGPAAELTDLALFTEAELLAFKGIGAKVIETTRRMLADHGLHLAGETPQQDTTIISDMKAA